MIMEDHATCRVVPMYTMPHKASATGCAAEQLELQGQLFAPCPQAEKQPSAEHETVKLLEHWPCCTLPTTGSG